MLRPLLLLPLRLLLLLLSPGLLLTLFLLRWMLSLDLLRRRLLAYLREKGLSHASCLTHAVEQNC